ncbi:AraC family transcriptional regulator [Geodermatophilus sabuli]|uniref:AraC-type DNA-binding protein n=1 Tax=Geodermatophilus sabuli TaxID=1564158 RepID=A0A285EEF3_9ACTN|nr:AraC family transcriptional regulator [Geodermatophilus sabuli]MBB3084448.1 AraC-like DNA-binding protein [Geodermatophilus sabuli]SNX97357.1 AraC-type DNA-binding protein [Geodermatophilus sabuli]
MRPGVRCATLDGYVRVARSCGLDPARLLAGEGLTVADLAVPDKWVPAAAVARLLDRTAVESGVEDVALRLAGVRRLATLGPLSVVLRQEPDLRSALSLLCRYEHSYNEALRLRLEEAGDLATMRLWFEFGEPAPARQALELATATLVGIVRELLGRQWEPLSLCFTHRAPASTAAHRAVFGPRLQFEHDFTGLVFYAAELDATNTMSDPLLRPYADQLREALGAPPAATVTGQVTQLVEMLLPVGRCSTRQVAGSLGMTERTLHRRLAAEGRSFSSIVHEVRAALAERHLAADRYTLTDVSELLGFTAPSAFSRWFRQQFGMSPSAWRATTRPAG